MDTKLGLLILLVLCSFMKSQSQETTTLTTNLIGNEQNISKKLQNNETNAVLEFPDKNFRNLDKNNITTGTTNLEKDINNNENNSTNTKNTENVENEPKLEFPKQQSINTEINERKLENLTTNKTIQISKTESEELSDLTKINEEPFMENPEVVPETIESKNPIDTGTELIENGENTEDVFMMENQQEKHHLVDNLEESINTNENGENGEIVTIFKGQIAAILAGIFVITSVVIYLGLLSYRRYLENRYGSRTMLVNEDFNDPDGMRNFSI